MDFPPEIAAPLLLVVGAVMFYLLRQKDASQQAELKELRASAAEESKKLSDGFAVALAAQKVQIDLLFKKHDEDVKNLHDLQIHVAEGHYQKKELDPKFDRLEKSITSGMDRLGIKFDKLSEILIAHIQEDKK